MKQLRLYSSGCDRDGSRHWKLFTLSGLRFFVNADGYAIVCRRAICKMWDVPKSAKKFWLCWYKKPGPHRYEIIRRDETWVDIPGFELWDDGETLVSILPELANWLDDHGIPAGSTRYVELQYTT